MLSERLPINNVLHGGLSSITLVLESLCFCCCGCCWFWFMVLMAAPAVGGGALKTKGLREEEEIGDGPVSDSNCSVVVV